MVLPVRDSHSVPRDYRRQVTYQVQNSRNRKFPAVSFSVANFDQSRQSVSERLTTKPSTPSLRSSDNVDSSGEFANARLRVM